MAEDITFMVEDADIRWLNFAGRPGMYNDEGDRNFCLFVDEDLAKTLIQDGWLVKFTKPKPGYEEEFVQEAYIEVKVKFENRPPRITVLTSTSRTMMTPDTVENIDLLDIEKVDLIVRAYEWNVNGKTGIKAYLQTMFITVREDDLERKYAVHDQDGD